MLVSPLGTDAQNGTALANALNGISDASATKRYLLKIEPGTYDVGTTPLAMQPYIDIEGSGRRPTQIVGGGNDSGTTGVVVAASNSELRSVSVVATDASTHLYAYAIYAGGANPFRLFDVAASAGGSTNISSALRVTNAALVGSVVLVDHSSLTGGGAGPTVYTVYSTGSSQANIVHSDVTASGGTTNYGLISAVNSPATINWSMIKGTTNSVYMLNSAGSIGASLLDGAPAKSGSGSFACNGVYNQAYTAVVCP